MASHQEATWPSIFPVSLNLYRSLYRTTRLWWRKQRIQQPRAREVIDTKKDYCGLLNSAPPPGGENLHHISNRQHVAQILEDRKSFTEFIKRFSGSAKPAQTALQVMSLAVAVSYWLSVNIISWAHGDSWEWDTSALFAASVGLMDSFRWERHHCWLMWGESTGSKRGGALKISFDTSKGETFASSEWSQPALMHVMYHFCPTFL